MASTRRAGTDVKEIELLPTNEQSDLNDNMALWRVWVESGTRLARGTVGTGPVEMLAEPSLDRLLADGGDALDGALTGPADGPVPDDARLLCPLEGQEVWASGVTYRRSRDARMEESGEPDVYDRVYEAERPELFAKAAPGRAVGPGADVGIRADSTWDVPEPELGVVADAHGQIAAYVLGNDMSSRSIEGENPLYLPQAKVYRASCAIGPCLVPVGIAPPLDAISLGFSITRSGAGVFTGTVALTQLHRSPEDLVGWLFKAMDFPVGVVLLTGTGIVPPMEFTLAAGDVVTVTGTGLGVLSNTVVAV